MNSRRYKHWIYWIPGWKELSVDPLHDSTFEQLMSNVRRAYSRFCFTIISLVFVWAFLFKDNFSLDEFGAWLLFLNGLWFFYYVVIRTPFRSGGKANALRLLLDTILSSAYLIGSFAIFYSLFLTSRLNATLLDNLYFSAVTFSTLGYGDIHPSPESQGFAAIEAIIGNLHLGMIVGATFAAITQTKK